MIVHGSHWCAALGDFDREKAINTWTACAGGGSVEKLNGNSLFSQKLNDAINSIVIIGKTGKTMTMYPQMSLGEPCDVKISEIKEEQNGEAWVQVKVKDASLCLFATDYLKNRSKYKIGAKRRMRISAIAYSVFNKPADKAIEINGKKIATKGMCAILPLDLKHKTVYPDDYLYRGQIMDKKNFSSGFAVKVKLIPDVLAVWLYSTNKSIGKKLRINDFIYGTMWLQGCESSHTHLP